MGELPTLLRSGFIIPPDNATDNATDNEKDAIKKTISIDYILRIIADMIPGKTKTIKNTPKNIGDRCIVLKSDTGSGKSTVLPVALYDNFFEYTRKNIIVTQPRILTAVDIPSTIVTFSSTLRLGKNIGYNTSTFKLPLQDKGIIFSTVGILTQELILNTDEEFMNKYQFIIIDEVHERDIDVDRCLYLLKKLLTANYKSVACPLIILMSATFNEEIFINYFNVPLQNFIRVEGKTFPITPFFTEFSVANYVQYATLQAQKIHLDNFADFSINNVCDIIIFVQDSGIGKKIYDAMHLFNAHILSGSKATIAAYTNVVTDKLATLLKTGGANQKYYYVLPILLDTASFSKGGLEYQNLFSSLDIISTPIWKVTDVDGNATIDTASEPVNRVIASRRIIIATNLAETGVTIPTLKYCIDTGLQLSAEFYPEYGCFALISKNVSYGSAVQRRGRVGRQAPGFWYPCYTEETYNALPKIQMVSIIVNDTTELLLTILIREKDVTIEQEYYASRIKDHAALGMFQMQDLHLKLASNWYSIKNKYKTNIAGIDFIELPSVQSLQYSVEKLHLLGFLDDTYNVTMPGYFANKFRFISLDSRRMILCGYHYGANILDLVTIAAFVQISKRKIFAKTFTMTNFLKTNAETFTFYNAVVIADDFINCIFVYNLLQHYITTSKAIITLDKIRAFCTTHGLLYEGLLQVIAARDTLIENMIDIGLDPYYNGLGIQYNLNTILQHNLSDGLCEVKKIKQCLYDGYRCNLLAYVKESTYVSLLRGVHISVKSNLVKDLHLTPDSALPRYIIVDTYNLSQKYKQAQFEFISQSYVSVLDGYVEIDKLFANY